MRASSPETLQGVADQLNIAGVRPLTSRGIESDARPKPSQGARE